MKVFSSCLVPIYLWRGGSITCRSSSCATGSFFMAVEEQPMTIQKRTTLLVKSGFVHRYRTSFPPKFKPWVNTKNRSPGSQVALPPTNVVGGDLSFISYTLDGGLDGVCCRCRPPSTGKDTPVTKAPFVEHRKAAASPISVGSAHRCAGVPSTKCLICSVDLPIFSAILSQASVLIYPGTMQFTLTPLLARALACTLIKNSTAAFACPGLSYPTLGG